MKKHVRKKHIWMLLLFCLWTVQPLMAMTPDEMLKDPLEESRARDIGQQLRCLVCQGEDIDDSNAGFARDIRALVRQRIAAGDSDAQVVDYVRARYGDAILMSPPLSARGLLVWALPFIVVVGGGFIVLRRLATQTPPASKAPLADKSPDDGGKS